MLTSRKIKSEGGTLALGAALGVSPEGHGVGRMCIARARIFYYKRSKIT